MSENEAVVQAMLELANRHEGSAIHSYLAEAMHAVNPTQGSSPANSMHAIQSALMTGFPDLQYRIDRLSSSGSTVVVECTISGTHTAAFAGVPPTNNRIEVPAAFSLEIEQGKLTNCRSYVDGLTLMEQIGALPAPIAAVLQEVG
jgi:steroid delta-isomerase-like uncharacterized protein